jgi:hypothetical protein
MGQHSGAVKSVTKLQRPQQTLLHGTSCKEQIQNTQIPSCINLLKPTGQVMHHQFNIQRLYALPTLYLCVLYLSENKQRLVPLTA